MYNFYKQAEENSSEYGKCLNRIIKIISAY